jgi:hypothetical protein
MSLFIKSSHENPVCFSSVSQTCNMPQPSYYSSLDRPNIPISTLFSNTLSLCSYFNVKCQASHPYKTQGKITILCTLSFIFLASKLEDKRFCTE